MVAYANSDDGEYAAEYNDEGQVLVQEEAGPPAVFTKIYDDLNLFKGNSKFKF